MAKKIDNTQNKIEELTNNWRRALADYQNLQKRTAEEREAVVKFANTILILKLLPTLDNLEKAIAHLGNNNVEDGLKMVIKQFKDVLRQEGVEEIEALGLEFNPDTMEAIEIVGGEENNKVMEVVAPGFTLSGKIIRPAKVKVSKKEEINNSK